MSGPAGHTGHTGATGRRGLQGTPYGAPGTTFYSTSGVARIVHVTVGRNINIPNDDSNSGVIYNLANAAGGTYNINFPGKIDTSVLGAFWTFTNNVGDSSNAQINFYQTAGVQLMGYSNAVDCVLLIGQSITFVYSGGSDTNATYIAI